MLICRIIWNYSFVGGIAGNIWTPEGTVSSGYSSGRITADNIFGGIAGNTADEKTPFSNLYFNSDGCSAEAIPNLTASPDTVAGKPLPAFTSGEVAYLLQGNQETQVWGQPLGGGADTYPVLTADSANRVYRVTFKTRSGEVETDHAVVYANPGGVGAGRMPEAPTNSTKGFAKWSMTDSADGEEFTAGTTVPRDMTVYAVWQEKYGGEAGEISISTAYGTAVTWDLSAYMSYVAGMGTAGKFTYTVESGNDGGWFTVLDDTLTVSGDTPAGRYSLTIKATEKAPSSPGSGQTPSATTPCPSPSQFR